MTLVTNRHGTGDVCERIAKALHIPKKTTLDLGCGSAPVTRHMEPHVMIDVDIREDSPPNLIVADIRSAAKMFQRWQFGTVYLIDTIEHLHDHEGIELLDDIEKLCDRVAIFTPLGYYCVTPESTNPHAHRSGWYPETLHKRGYNTWQWPIFHLHPDQSVFGAFWAWKTFRNVDELTPETVASISGIKP